MRESDGSKSSALSGPEGKRDAEPHRGPSPVGWRNAKPEDQSGYRATRPIDDSPWIETGTTIGDNLVVGDCVATGGMGQVYRARDTRLDRNVALKVLRPTAAYNPVLMDALKREALAMSQVVHPNVVGVHDIGRLGDCWYIVMEYVEGESLSTTLRNRGPLPIAEAVAIVRQVASGLAEAHAIGIVHRDIKPGNILLRRLASDVLLAKVVDFGVARPMIDGSRTASTGDQPLEGTPAYMSPEQISGDPLDGRSDGYSLAVVLFEMLTGQIPYDSRTLAGLLGAIPSGDLLSLAEARPEVDWPAALQRELSKALARDPDDRHSDVAAMATAFERAIGGGGRGQRGRAVPCPGCSAMVSEPGGFCLNCGGPVPLEFCPACGASADGEPYHCPDCGASLLPRSRGRWRARSHDLGEGDRADATMITAAVLVVKLGAAATRRELNLSFARRFSAVIERERGRVLAILGGEAVAAFGLGGLRDRDVESAVDAALALNGMASEVAGGLAFGVEMGGVATVGLGAAWGCVYATGSAVERARDAATVADVDGGVCLGPKAYREVRAVYETRPVASHRQVLRKHPFPLALGPAAAHGVRVPLVGRNAELQRLLDVASLVAGSGRFRVVALVGAGGTGKSRLARELLARLDGGPAEWSCELTRCSRSEIAPPYEPFAELLGRRIGAGELSDPALVYARVAELPGLDRETEPGEPTLQRAAVLARILGVGDEDEHDTQPAGPEPGQSQEMLEQLAGWLAASAAENPVAVVIDDAAGMDERSQELLEVLARRSPSFPLMVVLCLDSAHAGRIVEGLNLGEGDITRLDLGTLDVHGTAGLVRALLGSVEGDLKPLIERIHGFSGGLPRHVEQAVDILVDEGLLIRSGEGWQVGEGETEGTPLDRTFTEILRQRIGRLSTSERYILTAVAAAGDDVPRSMLARMLEQPISERRLAALIERGFLVEVPGGRYGGEPEIGFRHDDMRAAAAALAAPERVKQLRLRAAEWLLQWDGVRPPGADALIGEHLLAVRDHERACQALISAARKAMRVYSNVRAFDLFQAALSAAKEWLAIANDKDIALAALLDAARGHAEIGLRLGRFEAVVETVASADAAVERDSKEPRAFNEILARIGSAEGVAYESLGRYEEALASLKRVRDLAGAGGIVVYALGRQAMVLKKKGDPEAAEEAARRALQHGESCWPDHDLHRGLGSAHGLLGHVAAQRSEFEEARAHYVTALHHEREIGDRHAAAMVCLSLGNTAFRAGDLEQAGQRFEEAAEECVIIGHRVGLATAQVNLGHVLLDQGKAAEALRSLREAECTLRATGNQDLLPHALRLIADCLGVLGRADKARQTVVEGATLAQEMGASEASQLFTRGDDDRPDEEHEDTLRDSDPPTLEGPTVGPEWPTKPSVRAPA